MDAPRSAGRRIVIDHAPPATGDVGNVADGEPPSQGRVPLEVGGVITSGQLEVGVQLEDLEADLEAVPITTESRSK